MLRSGFLALAACALSAMLSACGGGSDDDEPVAGTSNVSVVEDTPLTFALADGDPNGDELTATIVTPPTKGDVVFAGSNPVRFTYTPHPNENGLDAFTYQLSDGNKTSNLGTVNIGINPVNDVPAIQPTATTDEDVTLTATLIVDADGDTFTSEIVTPPSHGTLTVDASNPGKFTYVPEADFNGEDSVELKASYTAADSTTATVTGTVVITVRPVDDPPVAVADAVRTVQGLAARFEPLANDRGSDGNALSVTITSAPSVGAATVNADGSIQYTPTASFIGNTSLEYQVRDARGRTSQATMSIGVGLTSGILYLSRSDDSQPSELYFADGARNFKVNAALAAGDSVVKVVAAKSAPIAFYLTQVGGLYRVDLRQPGVAQQVAQGTDIGELATDATGSKVAYTDGTNLELVDLAAPETVRHLAMEARQPYMSPSGSRVYYNGLITNIYGASGALFVVETSGDAAPRQITQTVTPPASTGPVTSVSEDEHRVYYSTSSGGISQTFGVDPDAPGSEFVVPQEKAPALLSAEGTGLRPDDGSFVVVGAARDLYVRNLRDGGQIVGIASGVVVEARRLIPNF